MTAADPFDLARFVAAQDEGGTYDRAQGELRAGRKRSHWMWFVFPQLAGLGRSATSRHFAITGRAEAQAYLGHPLLGPRLQDCVAILQDLGAGDPVAVLGPVDAQKLQSSLTLFAAVAADPAPFVDALDLLFGGRPDERTQSLLAVSSR